MSPDPPVNGNGAAPARTWPVYLLAAGLAGLSITAGRPGLWPLFVGDVFLCGALTVWLYARGPSFSLRTVLVAALVFRLFFLWLPPVLSDDAYRYVWDGILTVHGLNPYLNRPSDAALAWLHADPIFERLNSVDYYSVYPPVSQIIFFAGGLFYRFGWEVSFYVIKVLLAGCEFAALLVAARWVTPRTLMLYAWNPVVIVESAGQAHSEAALLLFLVLSIHAARIHRPGWSATALAAAGLVKLYPFFFFPFLVLRFGPSILLPAGLTVALLCAPFFDPTVPAKVFESLDLYVRLFEFNAGPYYATKAYYYWTTGQDWSKMIGPAFRTLFFYALPILYGLFYAARWRIAKAYFLTSATFLFFATTIHPWYWLGIILMGILLRRPPWPWIWLALCSMGTYLLYVDAAQGAYWWFVVLGWGGWLIGMLIRYRAAPWEGLQWVQRQRALAKVAFVAPWLGRYDLRQGILDLGAGEGYVGAEIAHRSGADVRLMDIRDMNRTDLPLTVFDGEHVPLETGRYDVTVLYFVLHHAASPERVLREALRVSRQAVIVVESVYEGTLDHRVLVFLDTWVNRIRSGGRMRADEAHVRFRRVEDWRIAIEGEGGRIRGERRRGRWIHKQHAFLITPGAGEATVQ